MDASYLPDAPMLGAGLLVVRLVLGPLMAAHGAHKLFGWFGGPGLREMAAGMEHLGSAPGFRSRWRRGGRNSPPGCW
jgi:uncharacterized membrane protein YphA (DoxX/SURF4 family)